MSGEPVALQCRMFYFGFGYKLLANVASFCALLLCVPVFFRKETPGVDAAQEGGVVLVRDMNVDYSDILPEPLGRAERLEVVSKPTYREWYLSKESKALFLKCLRRRPLHFYLNFLILRDLCTYTTILGKYRPEAIAVYVNERNIAAPVVSLMCETQGSAFVSFMHGEYLLQLIHGFMRFSRLYVWDEHYIDMFENDLRCAKGQFVVYCPERFRRLMEEASESDSVPEYYATYYFSAESKRRVKRVADAFRQLKAQGKLCKIRPHPRNSDLELLRREFKDFLIEDPTKVSVLDSLKTTQFAVGLSSTVLSEAFFLGKEVVIDDISEVERYNSLKERKYIMLQRRHRLLSELLGSNTETRCAEQDCRCTRPGQTECR